MDGCLFLVVMVLAFLLIGVPFINASNHNETTIDASGFYVKRANNAYGSYGYYKVDRIEGKEYIDLPSGKSIVYDREEDRIISISSNGSELIFYTDRTVLIKTPEGEYIEGIVVEMDESLRNTYYEAMTTRDAKWKQYKHLLDNF